MRQVFPKLFNTQNIISVLIKYVYSSDVLLKITGISVFTSISIVSLG